jgi:hypothetical protein
MELEFDKDMNTFRIFRPYINQEEGSRSLIIYNPEGGPDYGLYTSDPYPLCADKGHACYFKSHLPCSYHIDPSQREYQTVLFPHLKIYR